MLNPSCGTFESSMGSVVHARMISAQRADTPNIIRFTRFSAEKENTARNIITPDRQTQNITHTS